MAKRYKVIAPAIVVAAAGNEVYRYRGSLLPLGVKKERLDHYLSMGLIEAVDVEGSGDDDTADRTAATVEVPEGAPSEKWKVPQLQAYAAREGIDLEGATVKADILARLVAPPADPAAGLDPAGGDS